MILVIVSLILAVICPVQIQPVTARPVVSEQRSNEMDWAAFHVDAIEEYADEFTALFNSYETKVAKNGAMMIRQGNSGPYKFARKA